MYIVYLPHKLHAACTRNLKLFFPPFCPCSTLPPPTHTLFLDPFLDILSAGDAGMYGAEAHMMGPGFQVCKCGEQPDVLVLRFITANARFLCLRTDYAQAQSGMMMGDGRHRGQPIQVRFYPPSPSPMLARCLFSQGICKYLPTSNRRPTSHCLTFTAWVGLPCPLWPCGPETPSPTLCPRTRSG